MLRLTAGRPALIEDLLEAPARFEALAVPGVVDTLVHLVNLFETDLARLVHHAPNEQNSKQAERTPDEEDLRSERCGSRAVPDHERGTVSNTEVEKPIRGCRYRHGLCSHFQGVDLRCDNPSNGSPRRSEEEDVDGTEDNENCHRCIFKVIAGSGAKRRHDKLTGRHAGSANDEKLASAPGLDDEKSRDSRNAVDNVDDQGLHVWCGDSSSVEECRAVVHDEVNASQLLQHL